MPFTQRELFLRALEIEDPAERSAFLTRACEGDRSLKAQVEALLGAHAIAGDFLSGGALGNGHAANEALDAPGGIIGRYKILEKIGEGGFGEVYMAEQREPVKRRVALKIIKLGMDTRQVVGRFEAERQALALMEHPNIARVLDGGATSSGRPYFVMELVRGVPITQFCDEQRLDTTARLELFMEVCGAIQHAHQKGIIHRDIKPSNVLVTLHDDRPVPKVIDFGIAKAMQGDLTDKTVFTRFHEFLGTPAYMSPEQTQLNGLDADTRSDIYALGVLLYELLTGRTPFDARELLTASFDEMRRRIREEEPPRPSTRLRTLPQSDADTVAQNRRSHPLRLISSLRGDLDWIVLKCLEKDRSRRYESAGALSQDVRRFLLNEPVTAAAPSVTYRARKLIRRHRTAFTLGGIGLLFLVTATIVSGAFAIRAFRAEQLSRRDAAIAEAVTRFLSDDLFNEESLMAGPAQVITLPTLLHRASLRVQSRFGTRPEMESAIRSTLGRAYYNLGDFAHAEEQWQLAYDHQFRLGGERDPRTIATASDLSQAYLALGRLREARSLGERTLSLARSQVGTDHPLTIKLLSRLAVLCYHTADSNRAYQVSAQAVSLGRGRRDVEVEALATALDILGRMIGRSGDLARGERHVREALDLVSRELGPNHPLTIRSQNRLAAYLYNVGIKLPEAERLYLDALDRQRRAFGESHPTTLTIRANLGLLYSASQPPRLERALEQWLLALEHGGKSLPHSNVVVDVRKILKRFPPGALTAPIALPREKWRVSTTTPPDLWLRPDFEDAHWARLEDSHRGEFWLRQSVRLPVAPRQRWFLVIRGVARMNVYLNGTRLETTLTEATPGPRIVPLPFELLKNPRLSNDVLALHIHDTLSEQPVEIELLRTPGSQAELSTSSTLQLRIDEHAPKD